MAALTKFVLKPTVYCFHKCSYCDPRQDFYQPMIKSKASHMPFDLAKTVLEDAYSLGMKQFQLSGGDPLIYPHLVDLLHTASSYNGVFVFMNSVGTALTREYAQDILGAGLGAWNISLDSPHAEVHNPLRGVNNAWQASMDALALLSDLKKSDSRFKDLGINFQTVITRHNYKDFPELIRFSLALGIESIYFMNIQGDLENKFLLSLSQIQEFKEHTVPEMINVLRENGVDQVVQENAVRVLSSFFSTETNTIENYAKGIYWNSFEAVKAACAVPDYYALVEPNGDVLPCCLVEMSHTGIVGNVFKNSLKEIWTGEQFTRFRENRIPYCVRCPAPRNRTLGLVASMCRQFD